MTTIIEQFIDSVERSIDAEGIYPMPGIFQEIDGSLTIAMFALEGSDMLDAAERLCQKENISSAIIGLDTWCKPNQGTTLDSCIVIFHITPGNVALGVLEYTWDERTQEAITKPVNWQNHHWIEAYADLRQEMKTWIKE